MENLVPKLVYPCREYATSYIDGLREFGDRYPSDWLQETEHNFDAHLATLESRKLGDTRTEGIPQHMLWLVRGDRYLGHVNVRTKVNEKLLRIGGHIGYEIRPSDQGRGYGTLMLKLALEQARNLGVQRVLITCDEENVGSRRVIENNGGRLPERAQVDEWPKPILRYWIDLTPKERRVIANYEVVHQNAICVTRGTRVVVTERKTKPEWLGWIWCESEDGQTGWISKSYLDIQGHQAVLTHDYDAREVEVSAGELVNVLKEEHGWAWIKKQSGSEGWIPTENLAHPAVSTEMKHDE